MIVRHWMSTDLVTIKKEASIQEALALMKQESIRHLPVVGVGNELLGWVTDADLRGVLIASMLEELTLEDVMIRKPFTGTPDMPLEEAARILLEKRVGGLPVVENGALAGIITVVDILSAFITFLGLFTESSRLDVRYPVPPTRFRNLRGSLKHRGAEIISICHLPSERGPGVHLFHPDLEKTDLKTDHRGTWKTRDRGVVLY